MALLRHGPRMPPDRHEELTEIVKRYYGGREISEEDLERALLVGMSPRERRRFEKKRGYSFKHLNRGAAVETVQENHVDCTPTMGVVDTLKFTALDGPSANEATSNGVGRELIMIKDDVENPNVSSDVGIDGAVSVISTEHVSTDENSGSSELSASAVNPDDSCLSRRTPNGIDDLSPKDVEESTQAKHNSKLSLLGHGPHGKQVVEHLMKEYGKDGINQFCQRWRQVFVEAVKPRFLPSGWDINHSGRRDFGEFSVYNPLRQASGATCYWRVTCNELILGPLMLLFVHICCSTSLPS